MTLLARVRFKPTPADEKMSTRTRVARNEGRTTALQRHQHDFCLLLGHEDANGSITFVAVHIALVLDVTNTFLRQIVGDEREARSPLRDDENLVEGIS